jgi:alpha-beta hydrolase superfamily lysophospholipase
MPQKQHRLILFSFLALLAACSPRFTEPHNTALVEPELKETSFISFDGTELPLRTWLPGNGTNEAKFIMIALHGFNDYSNFIKGPAAYFTQHHIAVYAYDQRGFGNAPVRGLWSSTKTMGRDLKTLVHLLEQKYPGRPIYLLGHSMGGAVIIANTFDDTLYAVRGVILVAPAVWARSKMPFYQSASLWIVAHTFPWYTVTGEILGRTACSNKEVLAELNSDPLVIKATRFDTIYGLQNLMDSAYEAADHFARKTLLLYGKHDEIIPEEPVLDVFGRFPLEYGTGKKMIIYEEGYHMLLRDLQAENVLIDIIRWINDDYQH